MTPTEPPPDDDEPPGLLMTPEEFARRSGLSERVVRGLVKDRKLAAVKMGEGRAGRIYVLTSELERLEDLARRNLRDGDPEA